MINTTITQIIIPIRTRTYILIRHIIKIRNTWWVLTRTIKSWHRHNSRLHRFNFFLLHSIIIYTRMILSWHLIKLSILIWNIISLHHPRIILNISHTLHSTTLILHSRKSLHHTRSISYTTLSTNHLSISPICSITITTIIIRTITIHIIWHTIIHISTFSLKFLLY